MTNREAIHKLIMFRRILERGVFPVGYRFDAEPFDLAVSALEKQEQDRWIPVTERLPEDYSDVLVWFEYFRYGNYNRMFQTYGIGNYSKRYDSWTVDHESGWRNLRVFAWRPLPETYTGEES